MRPVRSPAASTPQSPDRISLSSGTWVALACAFVVLTGLLALTAVTLISQRQRTVLLNRQLGALVGEATYVLNYARPALAAVPARSNTIRSRVRALDDLVAQARPLIGGLSASGLPETVTAAGELIAALQHQNRLSATLSDVDALVNAVRSQQLVPRASLGIDALVELVQLQRRTLGRQQATLETARGTQSITARSLATTRATLLAAERTLNVAEQTLTHVQSLDRKVGPVP